jgi:acyl-CoA thioesterase II
MELHTELTQLVELISLEQLEHNLFRGPSQDLGWGTVYGGQVLGQALTAAARTVPEARSIHSLHAYFLRPGNVSKPIVYDVDRIRDGASFTTRRVVAIQNGEPIFNLAASFQKHEVGFDHQAASVIKTNPNDVETEEDRMRRRGTLDEETARILRERPFDIRLCDASTVAGETRDVWFKTKAKLPDNEVLHAALLAYASDYAFLTTALAPHGYPTLSKNLQLASIDHVMWFHRPFRVDTWLLHQVESPSASGARGLVRGKVFDLGGRLIASTAQEGLIRKRT